MSSHVVYYVCMTSHSANMFCSCRQNQGRKSAFNQHKTAPLSLW